jgi:predicted permease
MSGWPFRRVLRPGAVRSADAELREEIELYLDLRTEELVREGHAPAEARRIAEERFGDVARIEAEARREGGRGRREGGRRMMETLRLDVGYALRTFRRNPLFFVVGALTLALAVAGNTAVFSVLDAAVLEALPFPDADRLVFVDGYHLADGEKAIRYASVPEFRDWRERSHTVSRMVAVDPNGLTLSGEGEAERITGELVSRGFFELMGGEAALGRTFTPEEAETPDGAPLVVLSDGLWRRRFGADPAIVGRTIQLNDRSVTVVGVMPPGFRGVSPDVDAWLPLGMMSLVGSADVLDSRGTRFLGVIGRLAPGVDVGRAQDELDAIARDLQAEYPDAHADRWARVQSFREEYLGTTGRLLWILVGAGVLLLLIASANVANLLLVRAHARVRELAVRRAVGADGSRVVGQLFTESLVLAAVGGVLGLGLAWIAIRGIVPSIPTGVLPDFVVPELSVRVFLFSFAVVGLAGLVAGTAPAASGARADLAGALRTGGWGATGRRARAQQGFVVAQVGLALLLLVGAGLLTRSFRAQLAVDPGMDMRGMHVFRVQPPRERYPDAASLRLFTHELVRRLEAVPGVSAVAASSDFPFRGRSSGSYIVRPEDPEHLIRYHRHSVTPGYFEKLGVRVLRGRAIEEQDRADARGVAVVTQALVDRVFPDDPSGVGRTIAIGDPRDPDNLVEIVGVVANVRYRDLTQDMMAEANSPDLFFSMDQIPSRTLEVSFRVRRDLASVLPSVRSAVAGIDPAIPIFAMDSLEHAYRSLTATPRFAAFLMGLFSLLALVLSGVGIYGVLAFSVGQRTPEIALRRALGARAGAVAGSVIASALRLVGLGLVLGGVAAALGSGVLRRFLFGVAPTDPVTFGGVLATMVAVAVVAAALPAWRAARKSPVEALNAE